jgi:peroxiredoxin
MDEPGARAESSVRERGGRFRILAPLFVIGVVASGLAGVYFYRYTTASPQKQDLAQEAREDLERRNFRPLSAPLEALLADSKYQPLPTQAHPLLLQPAPDFTLLDVDGREWSLTQRLPEGPVVLVFYFGYHCNHCVSQLFALDKDLAKFRELGAQVVAVSADPAELTRKRFGKYGAFGFPVLSDPGNKVAEKYETYITNPNAGQEGDLLHGTFVISRQSKVMWANRGEGPFTENRTLLHELARVEGRAPLFRER